MQCMRAGCYKPFTPPSTASCGAATAWQARPPQTLAEVGRWLKRCAEISNRDKDSMRAKLAGYSDHRVKLLFNGPPESWVETVPEGLSKAWFASTVKDAYLHHATAVLSWNMFVDFVIFTRQAV